MSRGPKKHLKRLAAPKHLMLDKMAGVYAPKPSAGPHKSRECLPLIILIRNRLKYAQTRREAMFVMSSRAVKVDGKVRTDSNYPAGYQDVISIEKTNENFRLLFDNKGRFVAHRIKADEAKTKLCRVRHTKVGARGIPYIVTHDARTIRYPSPDIKVGDTVKVDLASGSIVDVIKYDVGNLCQIIRGRNAGRIGIIENKEKHDGAFELVHIRDVTNATFMTRRENAFVIGQGKDSAISLPRGGGVRLSLMDERDRKLAILAKK